MEGDVGSGKVLFIILNIRENSSLVFKKKQYLKILKYIKCSLLMNRLSIEYISIYFLPSRWRQKVKVSILNSWLDSQWFSKYVNSSVNYHKCRCMFDMQTLLLFFRSFKKSFYRNSFWGLVICTSWNIKFIS